MASAVRTDHTAARWRGGLVGACSAAVTVGAHGVGGGMLPGGAALVLLALGCAVVGVVAGGRLGCRGVGAVAALLVIGQAVGHLTLSFAAAPMSHAGAHAHGLSPTPSMLLAHLAAAVACAALICAAERLWSALATYVWRLIRALTATAATDETRSRFDLDTDSGRPHVRLGCTAGTRGPPLLFV